MATAKHKDLKEALVTEALAIIEDKGVDQLSFREVARRLGVSHQAPYKHFASKDHILAAVVAKCFASFAAHLEARDRSDVPEDDLRAMGLAYLDFAMRRPLHYKLMFNTTLPTPKDHPDMLANAQHAFSILEDRLKSMEIKKLPEQTQQSTRHDAMFIWSSLHGLATLMQSDAMHTIQWKDSEAEQAIQTLMNRMGLALIPD